jgi:hypothetical protein
MKPDEIIELLKNTFLFDAAQLVTKLEENFAKPEHPISVLPSAGWSYGAAMDGM